MERGAAEAILKEATETIGRRDGASARRLLQPLLDEDPSPAALFLLAQACRAEGDDRAEHDAIDQLLSAQPTHLGALLMKGAALSRAGDDNGAMGAYQAGVAVAEQAQRSGHILPQLLASEVGRAAQWVRGYVAERAARIDRALADGGFRAGMRSEAVEEALAILRGEAPI